MSGIYIKGMEMPKRCNECRFLEGDNMNGLCHAADRWMDDEDYWAWYVYEEDDIDTDKPANCPLIAIPDHGRLVDADAFEKFECNRCDGACDVVGCDCTNCDSDCRCDFMLDLHNAPTIIPADKGGANDV